jgi:perosamine synthetase
MEQLAILGGPKAVQTDPKDIFAWPIITEEDEQAVLKVLHSGNMSGIDVTKQFEKEFAEWFKVKYALGHCNGTAALQAAMFGVGLGIGDELICQSMTYWASALPAMNLGATVVFADMDPETMGLDAQDVERKITDRTKAIMVVHYCGHPSNMDAIMAVAQKHNIKVIEDVSHAQGGLYKGQLTGTFGDVAAMSLMGQKSLAIGEGGMLITNNHAIYERAVAYGHYSRTRDLTLPELTPFSGLPLGGVKNRMHQISAAVGRVQLKYYQERMTEIQNAMNYFWDLLEGAPGIRGLRPPKDSGSTNAGWYACRGRYFTEELGGLSVQKFAEAVQAEGSECAPGGNLLMHLHPLLNEADVFNHGKPTRIANSNRDVRQHKGSLPVTESLPDRIFKTPWFKHNRPEIIREHAEAYRKVVTQAHKLL